MSEKKHPMASEPGPWCVVNADDATAFVHSDREVSQGYADAADKYGKEYWGPFPLSDAAAAPRMRELLKFFALLISDSVGVDGFHLNGDIAEWGEFEETEELLAMFPEIAEADRGEA